MNKMDYDALADRLICKCEGLSKDDLAIRFFDQIELISNYYETMTDIKSEQFIKLALNICITSSVLVGELLDETKS